MIFAAAALLTAGAVLFTLLVRQKDLPEPEPVSPTAHLDERKRAIYENLRDLQFDYRMGKLSDADYAATKTDLQQQLAVVLAEMEKLQGRGKAAAAAAPRPAASPAEPSPALVCGQCGAKFAPPMKFCGQCGQPMPAAS